MKTDTEDSSNRYITIHQNIILRPATHSLPLENIAIFDKKTDETIYIPETSIALKPRKTRTHKFDINIVPTRKRQTREENWDKTIRKKCRQSGKAYVSTSGKQQPPKAMKYKNCSKCKYKCNQFINEQLAQNIFDDFWSLTDSEKLHFYDKTTKSEPKKRVRKENKNSNRPRVNSFQYNFVIDVKVIRVCKAFYLSLLNISQQRINYFHSNKKNDLGTPKRDERGYNTKKRISDAARENIREHIYSINKVSSHYTRKNTKREYFEFGMNMTSLYELYVEWCRKKTIVPQKKWLYNHIFDNEFNIGFFSPKKDLCDTCYVFDNITRQHMVLSHEEVQNHQNHVREKDLARKEKKEDKKNITQNQTVVCFDLQRVLSCPQSSVSYFYYSRKFAMYNLTGYDVGDQQAYCILWHEGLAGRDGNEIASATIKLLEQVVKTHQEQNKPLEKITLWSDACVPQNRNSHMSCAIIEFLRRNDHTITTIEQKYQEPGHSCVQEVDAVHSTIDRYIEKKEIHSPLAMLRELLRVRSAKQYKVVQLRPASFKNYKAVAKTSNLDQLPFTKVKHIVYKKQNDKLQYRNSYSDEIFKEVDILKKARSVRTVNSVRKNTKKDKSNREVQQSEEMKSLQAPHQLDIAKRSTDKPKISEMKIQDIKKLYKYFKEEDIIFWNSVLKQPTLVN